MSEGWLNGGRSYHVTELRDVLIRAKVGAADFEKHPDHYQRLLVSAELFRHGGPSILAVSSKRGVRWIPNASFA